MRQDEMERNIGCGNKLLDDGYAQKHGNHFADNPDGNLTGKCTENFDVDRARRSGQGGVRRD